MADNVVINPGSGGDTIAADDIGGKKYQRLKLTMGADGVDESDVASGNPLPVRSYAFDALGSITRPADVLSYIAGDCYSNSTSVPTAGGHVLAGVARASGGSGILTDLMITCSVPSVMRGRVWLFNQALSTTPADNAAIAISDTDIANVIGAFPFTLEALTSNSFAYLPNLAKSFTSVGTSDLRYLIEVTAAYVPVSGEVLKVRAMGLQAT